MKEILQEDLKNIQINILQHIDIFCKENNIKYFISGGTLIGAIRHKGFIPWDDDIDIMMLREDYDKFIELYSKNDTSQYKLYSFEKDKSFPYPFAKIDDSQTILIEEINNSYNMGVNIDLFPIDIAPLDKEEQIELINKNKKLINILTLKRLPIKRERSLLKNITLLISHLIFYFYPTNKIISKISKNAQSYSLKKTGKRGCLVWGYGIKEIIDECNYEDIIYVDFENTKFSTLKGWHNYLTSLFGDYMKLPPLEKRITHHHFKAYWKE